MAYPFYNKTWKFTWLYWCTRLYVDIFLGAKSVDYLIVDCIKKTTLFIFFLLLCFFSQFRNKVFCMISLPFQRAPRAMSIGYKKVLSIRHATYFWLRSTYFNWVDVVQFFGFGKEKVFTISILWVYFCLVISQFFYVIWCNLVMNKVEFACKLNTNQMDTQYI